MRASCRMIRMVSTSPLQEPRAIWRTSSRSTASRGRKTPAKSVSRRATSSAASGGRTIPAPVSPSLQLFCRLLDLPSGETGPCDNRPLALLASLRIVLGQMVVFNMASAGSASAADIGGSSPRCNRGLSCLGAPSAPFLTPASSPDDAILNTRFTKSSGDRSGIELSATSRDDHTVPRET